MKTCRIIKIIFLCVVFAFSSCENNSPEQLSLITVTGETTTNATTVNDVAPVLFTGNDIAWFNPTTREIKFRESFHPDDLTVYQKLHFYLGEEYLFTVHSYAEPIHSFAVNDLVLYMEMDDRYYLNDCYPLSIMDTNPTIKENKEKRAVAWDKFINQLKNEKKIKKYHHASVDMGVI